MSERMSKFRIINNEGFHMTFENGVTASVQFGPGNYCENKKMLAMQELIESVSVSQGCSNAEVAAWNKEGSWITKKIIKYLDDDVAGYLDTLDVLNFLNKCANYEEVVK